MSVNILVSISILKQQTNLTEKFDSVLKNFKYDQDQRDLLKLLNLFRHRTSPINGHVNPRMANSKIKSRLNKTTLDSSETKNTSIIVRDVYFNRHTLASVNNVNRFLTKMVKNPPMENFHQPKFIINNEQACSTKQNMTTLATNPLIVCVIHSHVHNYLRRKTMRDTWLSMNRIKVADLQLTDNSTQWSQYEYLDVVCKAFYFLSKISIFQLKY